ncbi:hypothetical protein [Nocardia iowensis]|uniref:Uncharacterized protein n=1 Tax=Nocardia iowensis TaxID=204891 RepID=A0ABX8REN8_NOCIO|nr:hypothetical protein [Nocardia iowensis]QXN88063.1 hypothetical protein KV110_20775 [Nocardia iowensis]
MSEGTDADNGLTDLLRLDAAGGRAELAFVELAHSITTGRAAYPRRYGSNSSSPSTNRCARTPAQRNGRACGPSPRRVDFGRLSRSVPQ